METQQTDMNAPLFIPVATEAPKSLGMEFESLLEPHEGLLIREKLYASQMMCAAIEKQLVFNVGSWDSSMPERLPDTVFAPLSGDFVVDTQPRLFSLREESECFQRYCCHQFRESTIGLFPEPFSVDPGAPGTNAAQALLSGGGWYGKTPLLSFFRPFRCTLVCPCAPCWMVNPQLMEVRAGDTEIGSIVMDWKWWNCCWPQLHYAVKDSRGVQQYDVSIPICENCCAPSCCNEIYRVDINDSVTGETLGRLENQWPGCNFRGLCMKQSAAVRA
jgi:hypothetical protein